MSETVAVLFSAGLDSAVLLAYAADREVPGTRLQPIYVSVGLAWEGQERARAAALLSGGAFSDRILPLVSLQVDMRDIYPATHWAVRGEAPGFDTPDEDVYIEGRNIVLLSKAAVFMARAKIGRVMMGTLAGNPFADASAKFFAVMGQALTTGLAAPIRIEAPFADLDKADVVRLGARLGVAMEATLSCMQPVGEIHCGRCSKCRERRDGFIEARVEDPTSYRAPPLR